MRDAIETKRSIAEYLRQTLGIEVAIQPWNVAAQLPAYLRERYSFYRVDLHELRCLIMADHGQERNTPANIAKHVLQVALRWNGAIIYEADTLSATDRSRLVAGKVPFMVPGRQLYLYPLGIDFRERYPLPETTPASLSAVAQLIVLSVLLDKEWAHDGPTGLAKHLGYTKMTVGRAFSEIEAAGLATIRSMGRTKRLAFALEGKALWQAAAPFMRTPVKAETEENTLPNGLRVFVAGLSALSECTNLAAPASSIYATHFSGLPANASLHKREGNMPHDTPSGAYVIQQWIYDPAVLAENHRVDRLSLFLSLRGSTDERIEKALDELLDGILW
jgi:DNA-binding MarR family transcriptional regulator